MEIYFRLWKSRGSCFTLVNKKENLYVVFKKLNSCVYESQTISQYQVDGKTDVKEPQEKDIHKDILFKLCMDIKEKYAYIF